jgi:hypothetical protein
VTDEDEPDEDRDEADDEEANENGLPAPSFMLLVSNFGTQALMELGEIPNPITKRAEFAPHRAKFTIDLLEIIKEKTSGNLEPEEERFLDGALFELRMKYVRRLGGG